VSEHLHERTRCKTIFATHYHELTQLAQDLEAVRNFNVAVREVNDDVLFLHRLQPGGADRSYGIEVGRLAGLPREVLSRARQVLQLLEGEQLAAGGRRPNGNTKGDADRLHDQLGLFVQAPNPLVERLASLNTDAMTPLEALTTLAELSTAAKRGESSGV
jgi:DNA mismatch repair protein MutS